MLVWLYCYYTAITRAVVNTVTVNPKVGLGPKTIKFFLRPRFLSTSWHHPVSIWSTHVALHEHYMNSWLKPYLVRLIPKSRTVPRTNAKCLMDSGGGGFETKSMSSEANGQDQDVNSKEEIPRDWMRVLQPYSCNSTVTPPKCFQMHGELNT